MKRMGALLGITSLVVLSFAYFIGVKFSLILSAIAFVLFVLSFIVKKYRKNYYIKLVLGVVVFSALFFAIFTNFYYKPIVYNNSDEETAVSGIVIDSPYENFGQYYYPVKTTTIGSDEKSVKITLISKGDLKADLDDTIDFVGTLKINSTDYYKTKGYYLRSKITDSKNCAVTKATSHSIKYFPYKLREMLVTVINSYMDSDNSGICSAIGFGERNYLTDSVKSDFKKAGMSHLLVVSGMHMSVVSMIFLFIFKKLFKKKFIYCPITILLVLFYMVLTGLSFSVIRSSIMVILMLLGMMISRQSDSLNSLGISAFVILLFNPYSAGDVGLLLSFGSTMGIILFSKPIRIFLVEKLKFHKRILIRILDLIAITLSACTFSTPILILFFKRISFVQIFSNLLISPVFEFLLIVVMIGGVLGLTGIAVLYSPFLFIADKLATYIRWVASTTSKLPFSYISTNKVFVYVFLGMCFTMICLVVISKNYKRTVPLATLIMIFVLVVGSVSDYIVSYNTPRINVYDTGNGITLSVHCKNKSAILSSGGSVTYDPITSLGDSSNSYDFFSITDNSSKRSIFSSDVLNEFDLKKVLLYHRIDKGNYENTYSYENISEFKKDTTVNLGDIKITYIVRNNNVFIYAKVNDKSILILPSSGDCKYLDKQYRNPNITVTDKSYISNSNLINTNLLILCCTEDSYKNAMKNIAINSNELYTTFNGDFSSKIEVW